MKMNKKHVSHFEETSQHLVVRADAQKELGSKGDRIGVRSDLASVSTRLPE